MSKFLFIFVIGFSIQSLPVIVIGIPISKLDLKKGLNDETNLKIIPGSGAVSVHDVHDNVDYDTNINKNNFLASESVSHSLSVTGQTHLPVPDSDDPDFESELLDFDLDEAKPLTEIVSLMHPGTAAEINGNDVLQKNLDVLVEKVDDARHKFESISDTVPNELLSPNLAIRSRKHSLSESDTNGNSDSNFNLDLALVKPLITINDVKIMRSEADFGSYYAKDRCTNIVPQPAYGSESSDSNTNANVSTLTNVSATVTNTTNQTRYKYTWVKPQIPFQVKGCGYKMYLYHKPNCLHHNYYGTNYQPDRVLGRCNCLDIQDTDTLLVNMDHESMDADRNRYYYNMSLLNYSLIPDYYGGFSSFSSIEKSVFGGGTVLNNQTQLDLHPDFRFNETWQMNSYLIAKCNYDYSLQNTTRNAIGDIIFNQVPGDIHSNNIIHWVGNTTETYKNSSGYRYYALQYLQEQQDFQQMTRPPPVNWTALSNGSNISNVNSNMTSDPDPDAWRLNYPIQNAAWNGYNDNNGFLVLNGSNLNSSTGTP